MISDYSQKDWCCTWRANISASWSQEQNHWEETDAGKDWAQEKKETTEGEMAEKHCWLKGHGFEYNSGRFEWQVSPGFLLYMESQESDTTEWPHFHTQSKPVRDNKVDVDDFMKPPCFFLWSKLNLRFTY